MSFSIRLFVLDQTDRLLRLPAARYSAMLAIPEAHRCPQFGSQRIRAAEAAVELIERRSVRVVRVVFFMLGFDEMGTLDVNSLMRQAGAVAGTFLPENESRKGHVVDARNQFVIDGGRWNPARDIGHFRTLTAVAGKLPKNVRSSMDELQDAIRRAGGWRRSDLNHG